MLETEPEVVLCMAPMPQVATSMSKELGPFVDGPPVEMCESYAIPGPAGCAEAARDPRDPDVTLTKLVPLRSTLLVTHVPLEHRRGAIHPFLNSNTF